MKCPTEMTITDRREKELADLGFVPLVHCKDTGLRGVLQRAELPESRSCTTPIPLTPMPACRRQIPYIMAVSRFAHYLKDHEWRDKIGSFMSRTDAEIFLESLDYPVRGSR